LNVTALIRGRRVIASLSLSQRVRQSTTPNTISLTAGARRHLTRSKPALVLENALLRQQLVVLQRQVKRPALTWRDRAMMVILAGRTRSWRDSLLIVKPETLLRWHRDLFRRPSDSWVAQQLREATAFGSGPTYLIRDNDRKFGTLFDRVAVGSGIKTLRIPYRAPRANAICERFLGSLRRECLDHHLILNERQLYRTVAEYMAYFNHARPHQGIGQRIPSSPDPPIDVSPDDLIVSIPVLGGLHHDYRRRAA